MENDPKSEKQTQDDTKQPVKSDNQGASQEKIQQQKEAGHKPSVTEKPEKPAQSKSDRQAAPAKQPGREKKKRGAGRSIFNLVLLLVIVGGGYYVWDRYGDEIKSYINNPETQTRITDPPAEKSETPAATTIDSPDPSPVAAEPSNTDRALDEVKNLVTRQAAELERLRDRVGELQLELNSQQTRLQALSTTTREDWLLAEAEYLLRLANQRILTEKQSANALSLLQSADGILKELDAPGLYAVRKAVAQDITRLRIAGAVDREGLYLKLDALIDVIQQLQFPELTREDVQEETVAEPVVWYRKLAHNAWQALKNLSGIVRVEKIEETADPRLLPSEEKMVRINLRLALEQAQLALMREEASIYTTSLERARELVAGHFGDDSQSRVMLAELGDLADREITSELPAVTGSIRALQDYIALMHNSYKPEDASPGPTPAPAPGAADNPGGGNAPKAPPEVQAGGDQP